MIGRGEAVGGVVGVACMCVFCVPVRVSFLRHLSCYLVLSNLRGMLLYCSGGLLDEPMFR